MAPVVCEDQVALSHPGSTVAPLLAPVVCEDQVTLSHPGSTVAPLLVYWSHRYAVLWSVAVALACCFCLHWVSRGASGTALLQPRKVSSNRAESLHQFAAPHDDSSREIGHFPPPRKLDTRLLDSKGQLLSDDPLFFEDILLNETVNSTALDPTGQDDAAEYHANSSRALLDDNERYSWVPVNMGSKWSPRYAHTSVLNARDELFVVGGATVDYTGARDVNGYLNDVWASTDMGASWEAVEPRSDRFVPRRGHVLVMNFNRVVMFLLGGFCGKKCFMNDWWSSETGAVWHKMGGNANAPWTGRHGHAAVMSSKERLTLLGGHNGGSYLNDVWEIMDPAQALHFSVWTIRSHAAPWKPRYGHAVVTDSVDAIFLMGGFFSHKQSGRVECFNDVWRSEDGGGTWSLINAQAPWTGRYQHSAVMTASDEIFITGGLDLGLTRCGDAWRSKDGGGNWDAVTKVAQWPARFEHTMLSDPHGRLTIIGGMSTGTVKFNDIWHSFSTCADDMRCPGETMICRDGKEEKFTNLIAPICVGICDRRIFDNCKEKEACHVRHQVAVCYDPCDGYTCGKGEVCEVASRDGRPPRPDVCTGKFCEEAQAYCLACDNSKTMFACSVLRQCQWDTNKEVCQMRCDVPSLRSEEKCEALDHCTWDVHARSGDTPSCEDS